MMQNIVEQIMTKANELDTLIESLGPGREEVEAKKKLEECLMWIEKSDKAHH